jgi:hypothetical protein
MRLIVMIWHDTNHARRNPGRITLIATFPAATQTLLAPLPHPIIPAPLFLWYPTVFTYSNHSLGYVFIGPAESEGGRRFWKGLCFSG